MNRFWLSFADPQTGDNIGVNVVDAPDFMSAVHKSHELGINPGGEVLGSQIDPAIVPDAYTNRLLSKDECAEFTETRSTREIHER